MILKIHYECSICNATKLIVEDTSRTGVQPQEVPKHLPCGWRGCEGTMTIAAPNPFDFKNGARDSIDAANLKMLFDAEFRAVVEYATMFALTENVSPMSVDQFKQIKDRVKLGAAIALIISEQRV
jgi:hypothetical protein